MGHLKFLLVEVSDRHTGVHLFQICNVDSTWNSYSFRRTDTGQPTSTSMTLLVECVNMTSSTHNFVDPNKSNVHPDHC